MPKGVVNGVMMLRRIMACLLSDSDLFLSSTLGIAHCIFKPSHILLVILMGSTHKLYIFFHVLYVYFLIVT